MRARNFDVGDLVETLELQKETTQKKHSIYSNFFVQTTEKHHTRVKEYITELASKAAKVREDAETQKSAEQAPPTTDPERGPLPTPSETPETPVQPPASDPSSPAEPGEGAP